MSNKEITPEMRMRLFLAYSDAEIEVEDYVGHIVNIDTIDDVITIVTDEGDSIFKAHIEDCTLRLHSLDSLTDEQKIGWYILVSGSNTIDMNDHNDRHWAVNIVNQWIGGVRENMKFAFKPSEILYLLSLHIDILGAEEMGVARIVEKEVGV